MSEKIYLGFDIGGTKIGIGLVSASGKLIAGERVDNVNTKPEEILPQLAAIAKKLIAENNISYDDIPAFGISTPGPADIPNGIITTPPNNPFWRNVPILKYLQDALNIKGYFENDANAAAIAEGYFGAGRNSKDYVFLTMSTGIGAGIVTNGTLIQGTGFFGGEYGHTVLYPNGRQCNCGLKGCYEAYAGGRALAQRMQEDVAAVKNHPMLEFAEGYKAENLDLLSLEKAARAGVDYAVKLWDEMCLRNAQAYGMLMNIFNPEKIVLGTIAYAAGDFFMDPIKHYLPEFAWPETLEVCEVVPSKLRRDIGSYAGIAGALYALEQQGVL